MISHVLLPKQVTPFLIQFPDAQLSNVGSIRMSPFSILVPASADPVIEIDNQKFNPAPNASLTGQLINQSGQVVNVAHVMGTLYDKSGQVVWVADQYVDSALLPQTPVAFNIPIPEDMAKNRSAANARLSRPSASEGRCEAGVHIPAREPGSGAGSATAQDEALSLPKSIEAGSAFSIQNAGSGEATLYIVGPGQVLKQTVQLGEPTYFPAGSLYNAGHYVVILAQAAAQTPDHSM